MEHCLCDTLCTVQLQHPTPPLLLTLSRNISFIDMSTKFQGSNINWDSLFLSVKLTPMGSLDSKHT